MRRSPTATPARQQVATGHEIRRLVVCLVVVVAGMVPPLREALVGWIDSGSRVISNVFVESLPTAPVTTSTTTP